MPDSWEPWVIMMLPPGGFLTLGIVLLTLSTVRGMRTRRDAVRVSRRAA
jgi:Na+-translocating ferredoxin:NAD+ oxidoreductase RnfE subunit